MSAAYFTYLIFAASLGASQPGELKTFTDWTVGCDNGLNCHATSLNSENDEDRDLFVTVKRDGAEESRPVVTMFLSSEMQQRLAGVTAVSVALDDKLFPAAIPRRDGSAVAPKEGPFFFNNTGELGLSGTVDAVIIGTMIRAERINVVDTKGAVLGGASLAGLSAALLYIDQRQNRLGTVTAFVRKGSKPASFIPTVPKIPLIKVPPRTSKSPFRLSAASEKQERLAFKCRNIDEVMWKYGIKYYRLDIGTTLALIPPLCGTGAYNASVRIAVINNKGDIRTPAVEMSIDAETPDLLINAWWDEKAGTLNSFMKARGLGDCGMGQTHVWDGAAFRLIRQIEMNECRGSTDYITTWRAQIASAIK